MTDTPTQAELLEALEEAIELVSISSTLECGGDIISQDRLEFIRSCESLLRANKHPMAAGVEAQERIDNLRLGLLSVAIYDQDDRPLDGDDTEPDFDWRRRSMKQEGIARKALHDDLAAAQPVEQPIQPTVTVCDRCLRASCWQGTFMCEEAKHAGTVEKTVDELRGLDRECHTYWNLPSHPVDTT